MVVRQPSQNHNLCLAREPSSPGTHIRTSTRSAHTHRRPSNVRGLSSVMSVGRLHREAHRGTCSVDGELRVCTDMAGLEASSHDRTLRFQAAGCKVKSGKRNPQPPPWTARRRESDKGSVGARGARAAGMVRSRQILLLSCRSYLCLALVARLQATTPMKVNLTHFQTLAKANRGRPCS